MKKSFVLVVVMIALLVSINMQASSQEKWSWRRGVTAAALYLLATMGGAQATAQTMPTQYGAEPFGSASYPIMDTGVQSVVPADFDVATSAVFCLEHDSVDPKQDDPCLLDPSESFYNRCAERAATGCMLESIEWQRVFAKNDYDWLERARQLESLQRQWISLIAPQRADIEKLALHKLLANPAFNMYSFRALEDKARGMASQLLHDLWLYANHHPRITNKKVVEELARLIAELSVPDEAEELVPADS